MSKKVLVTGADGFIGSHLVEELIRKKFEVKAFVFYNSFNSCGWLDTFPDDVLRKIEIVAGDIRDYRIVEDSIKGVDTVFHLAALIGIPFSYHSPESYVDTNVKGTLNILQSSKKLGTRKVLVTSTSEVYGTAKYVPIDESHPRQGQSPYSATKIGADSISESFYRSFNLPVTIVRPFNTYGPRQSARAVIPAIIIQLLNGMKKIKLGALDPTRDLVFVKDTVRGFLEIAKSEKLNGEEVNIATDSEISINDLARKIINMINPEAKIISDIQRRRPKNSEVERLRGSNKKIMKTTKWKQEYSLDEGLRKTIQWFRDPQNLKKYKVDAYNL